MVLVDAKEESLAVEIEAIMDATSADSTAVMTNMAFSAKTIEKKQTTSSVPVVETANTAIQNLTYLCFYLKIRSEHG